MRLPYDLDAWLIRATALSELGYIDLATADYFKTLKLAKLALDPEQASNPISFSVRFIVGMLMLVEKGPAWDTEMIAKDVDQKIAATELACYINLVQILKDFTAFWDAIKLCEELNATAPKRPQWASDPYWNQCSINHYKGIPSQLAQFLRHKKKSSQLIAVTDEIEIEAKRGGVVVVRKWPWMDSSGFTRGEWLLKLINKELKEVSLGMIEVRKSLIRDGLGAAKTKKQKGQSVNGFDVLGLFARRDIARGETFLVDKPMFAATRLPKPRQCSHCLEDIPFPSDFSYSCLNCTTKYCSPQCFLASQLNYHKPLCGKDFSWIHDRYSPGWSITNGLLLKILAHCIRMDIHPLEHPLVARLTANYENNNTETWSLENLSNQIKMLEQLGINVYSDLRFDTWVLSVICARISNNAIISGHKLILRPHYSLLNHSCERYVDAELSEEEGEALDMETIAVRPIKKGKEIFTEYFACEGLDRAVRQKKGMGWFGTACRCTRCEREKGMP